MKTFKVKTGPFTERPFYTDQEIDSICTDELRRVGLFPSSPEPVRIDRFVEKRFGVVPQYEDLPQGLLGFTKFGPKGVEAIAVSRLLSEENSKVAERRINTTLAHEGGHGLLHAHLFALELRASVLPLFEGIIDQKQQKILCRTDGVQGTGRGEEVISYNGRWWEYQANRMIGALLLPRTLVPQALETLLEGRGTLGMKALNSANRSEAVRILADIFDVNPVVARIRLAEVFPPATEGQLAL